MLSCPLPSLVLPPPVTVRATPCVSRFILVSPGERERLLFRAPPEALALRTYGAKSSPSSYSSLPPSPLHTPDDNKARRALPRHAAAGSFAAIASSQPWRASHHDHRPRFSLANHVGRGRGRSVDNLGCAEENQSLRETARPAAAAAAGDAIFCARRGRETRPFFGRSFKLLACSVILLISQPTAHNATMPSRLQNRVAQILLNIIAQKIFSMSQFSKFTLPDVEDVS